MEKKFSFVLNLLFDLFYVCLALFVFWYFNYSLYWIILSWDTDLILRTVYFVWNPILFLLILSIFWGKYKSFIINTIFVLTSILFTWIFAFAFFDAYMYAVLLYSLAGIEFFNFWAVIKVSFPTVLTVSGMLLWLTLSKKSKILSLIILWFSVWLFYFIPLFEWIYLWILDYWWIRWIEVKNKFFFSVSYLIICFLFFFFLLFFAHKKEKIEKISEENPDSNAEKNSSDSEKQNEISKENLEKEEEKAIS